jgi:hypothetical protein
MSRGLYVHSAIVSKIISPGVRGRTMDTVRRV